MAAFTGWSNEGAQTLANSLSGLGQVFGQAIEKQGKQQMLADLGQKYMSGDLAGAKEAAVQSGNLDFALQMDKMDRSTKADLALQNTLNGGTTASAGLTPTVYANNPQLGTFGASANRVLGFEGADGKVTTDNNGAPVKFGINGASHPGLNIANLSKGQALQIYKKEYWDALGLDEVAKTNPALAHAAFDTAINAGPGKAKELMQASGGDANKLLDLRGQFNQSLIQSDPNGKYGPNVQKAWSDRLNNLRSDIGGGQQPQQQGNDVNGLMAKADTLSKAMLTPNLSDERRASLKAMLDDTWKRIEFNQKQTQENAGAKLTQEMKAREQQVITQGGDPKDPRNQTWINSGKYPKEDQSPLTATDKQAIMAADEMVMSNQNVISNLKEAKDLSKKALGFKGAGIVAQGGALIGNEASQATVEMDNLITQNALGQLKAVFGGAPTEGERAILMQIQGASSQPDSVRQKIFDRAIDMANKRLEFNKQKADELRGGTYYKSKDANSQPQKTNLTPPAAADLQEAKQRIAAGVPRETIIKFLEEHGHSAEGL